MLAERVQVWNRQLIEKGRKEGEVEIVLWLLEQKLGPLDEAAIARVRAARASQRRAWAKRLLSASTLEEVFG
jgi:hypothetical protein